MKQKERQKELKPVNNNCCGKKISISGNGTKILIFCETYKGKNIYWCVDSKDEENFIEKKESIKIIGFNREHYLVWRFLDVIYGDEDE